MKSLAILFLICFGVKAADLAVTWDNATNNGPAVIYTRVYWGISPRNYTNFIQVPITTTNLTITNLVGGVKYYCAAVHSDGTDESPYSNELMAKTAIHPPKLTTLSKP